MDDHKIRAHGAAAESVIRWLRRMSMEPVTLHPRMAVRTVGGEPSEDAIHVALAPAAGRQIAANGRAEDHITADDDGVSRAIDLCAKARPADPISLLEMHYDNLMACLKSPRVAHLVRRLRDALLQARHLDGARAARIIADASREELPDHVYSRPGHPRQIYVVDGHSRQRGQSSPPKSSPA
jgi:hypothetical protein